MSHPCSQRLVRRVEHRLHDCVSVTMIYKDPQFTYYSDQAACERTLVHLIDVQYRVDYLFIH